MDSTAARTLRHSLPEPLRLAGGGRVPALFTPHSYSTWPSSISGLIIIVVADAGGKLDEGKEGNKKERID